MLPLRRSRAPLPGVRLTDIDPTRHGLVVRHEAGIPSSTWYRSLKRGHLELVHPGVARLPGAPVTYRQSIAAAVWASGGNALASHRSAAHLLGLIRLEPVTDGRPLANPDDRRDARRIPRVDLEVDVMLPGRSRKLELSGVTFHRPTDDLHLTPQRIDGIRCTNTLRTLVDLGAVAPELVTAALGVALADRRADLNAVASTIEAHSERGRHGVVALRQAFEHWAIDGRPADSVLESAFRRLIRRFDLPEVEFHAWIEGWEVDFVFVGTNVIVECDGWTTHGLDRDQFERDRRRDDDLRAAGWHVLRFTYRAIIAEPADTARRIRRALHRAPHAA
ncbi:MAG: DUF559 domain-containing protein [Ilumatobacter sp.]|uniref:DUF559 domain-containing protein n=1 Tax=Ilumatobacter sp. TaxID=1967498 RepID=UPI00391A25F5